MALDVILFILFFLSTASAVYILSDKIPELIAIPDSVITANLHSQSAKFRLFLFHSKTLYREGYFAKLFWKYIALTFLKIHIGVMKLDNNLIKFIKFCKDKSGNGFNIFPVEITKQKNNENSGYSNEISDKTEIITEEVNDKK